MGQRENEKLFNLYTLTELAYEKHFKYRKCSRDELYPSDWYSKKDYIEKINLMVQAIKKNLLIEELLLDRKMLYKRNDNK